MQVYEIALPVHDNKGKAYRGAHEAFQGIVVQQFGGYTKRPSGEGAWYSEASGRVMYDQMVPYRIAVPDDSDPVKIRGDLVALASGLFSDQEAFYVAYVGLAWIEPAGARRATPDKAHRGQGAGKTDGAFEAAAAKLLAHGARQGQVNLAPPLTVQQQQAQDMPGL